MVRFLLPIEAPVVLKNTWQGTLDYQGVLQTILTVNFISFCISFYVDDYSVSFSKPNYTKEIHQTTNSVTE